MRKPNFEILRVLAMFFIVVWHCFVHGICHTMSSVDMPTITTNSFVSLLNFISLEFIMCITSIAVNCYVLISGYFLINSDYKLKKIVKIWFIVVFYSFCIYAILCICGSVNFGFKEFVKVFFPIRCNEYWFVTMYLALLALAPFLSKLVHFMNKKEYVIFLITLFIININLPVFFPYGQLYGGGYSLLWFIFLFYVSGYIRLYGLIPKWRKKVLTWFILLSVIFCCIGLGKAFYLHYLGEQLKFFMLEYNGCPFFISVLLFLWIKYHEFPNNRFCNFIVRIAPFTFGVYLIHDHPLVRMKIWNEWFNLAEYQDSGNLLLYMVGIAISIFCLCLAIDYVRTCLFAYVSERHFFIRLENFFSNKSSIGKLFIARLQKKLHIE